MLQWLTKPALINENQDLGSFVETRDALNLADLSCIPVDILLYLHAMHAMQVLGYDETQGRGSVLRYLRFYAVLVTLLRVFDIDHDHDEGRCDGRSMITWFSSVFYGMRI